MPVHKGGKMPAKMPMKGMPPKGMPPKKMPMPMKKGK